MRQSVRENELGKPAGWGTGWPLEEGWSRDMRGTLTPAASPLPFPYTAAPASPGPAPALAGTAADTRAAPRYHGPQWSSLSTTQQNVLTHGYSWRNVGPCLYRDTRVRRYSGAQALTPRPYCTELTRIQIFNHVTMFDKCFNTASICSSS